jgi:hypothetical protein
MVSSIQPQASARGLFGRIGDYANTSFSGRRLSVHSGRFSIFGGRYSDAGPSHCAHPIPQSGRTGEGFGWIERIIRESNRQEISGCIGLRGGPGKCVFPNQSSAFV